MDCGGGGGASHNGGWIGLRSVPSTVASGCSFAGSIVRRFGIPWGSILCSPKSIAHAPVPVAISRNSIFPSLIGDK